jgi:hypothetical protein
VVHRLFQHNLQILHHRRTYKLSHTKCFQIKLAGMSIIFHCTILHLSKCNDSWAASIKQNIYFNFQPPSNFVFFVFHKKRFKVVHHSNIWHNSKFHGFTLTGANFISASEVWTAAFWDDLSYMVETMASRSSSMAWAPDWISWKSSNSFKSY